MKSRLTLIFAVLVVLLGTMIWVVQDRRVLSAAPGRSTETVIAVRDEPVARQTPALVAIPAAVVGVAAPNPQGKPAPMVHVDPSGNVTYVARDGDTVSQLSVALLGSDSKEHRDAVVAANPSLQSNPDRVLEGQTYSSGSTPASDDGDSAEQTDAASAAAVAPASDKHDNATDAEPVVAATAPKLKYIAQPGDTVGGLAANLLGGDTQANRDGIIARNASLQQDPDHLIAGKSYTIVARNGLAADPDARATKAPTTQPDADDAARLSVGRALRYTAQPGDTVSKLAVILLGSDTDANRDLITKSNPTLKQDPDHLVAGKTYWIAAPTADAMQ